MPGIWVLALPLADLAMSFHLSGPQVTSWKYERFIWLCLMFLLFYDSVTPGKEKVMREETKSLAPWGLNLKVIRVLSTSSSLSPYHLQCHPIMHIHWVPLWARQNLPKMLNSLLRNKLYWWKTFTCISRCTEFTCKFNGKVSCNPLATHLKSLNPFASPSKRFF